MGDSSTEQCDDYLLMDEIMDEIIYLCFLFNQIHCNVS